MPDTVLARAAAELRAQLLAAGLEPVRVQFIIRNTHLHALTSGQAVNGTAVAEVVRAHRAGGTDAGRALFMGRHPQRSA
jgi:hypothetical protein